MASEKSNQYDQVDQFIYRNWKLLSILVILVMIYFFRNEILLEINKYKNLFIEKNIINYIFLFLIIYLLIKLVRMIIKNKRLIWCRYMPHLSDEAKSDDIKYMMAEINKVRLNRITRFLLGDEYKSFMIYKSEEGFLYYYFAVDKSLFLQLKSSLKKSYLNAKLEYVGSENIKFPDKKYIGGRMNTTRFAKRRMLAFKKFKYDYLPNIINSMPDDSFFKVDFKRTSKKKDLKKISESEEEIKEIQTKDRTGSQKMQLKNLQYRLKGSESGFNTFISLATSSEKGVEKLKSVGYAISTALEDDASLYYKKYKNGVAKYPIFRPTFEMLDAGKIFLTGSELANLIHLPNYAEKNELIQILRDKTDMHDKTLDLLSEGVFDNPNGVEIGFVKLADGNERPIKVSLDSLKDHLAITGKTGSGKSSVIVAILDGLIKEHFDTEKFDKAAGLTFLDPGQDTALTLYNRLLKYYNEGGEIDWNKVNYLSIKDTEYPLAMNLLDKDVDSNSDTSLSSIAEAISDIIESAMPSEAPVAKRLLSKCIETLLADEERHTILDVKLLVKNTSFRNAVLKRIKNDPSNFDLIDYWETDAEDNLKTSETALMNRLEIFTSSPVLKRMFGQENAEMNFRKILDEGHIYLFDMTELSKSEMRIIGGYLSYRYYKASIGRARNSRLHILGFDETKVLGKMPYLTNIIAETRKFNLAGLVGAQMFGQLDSKLKMNLKDVQDNFISCKQGFDEAKEVAGFLSDNRVEIDPKDLTRLNQKKRECYIALKDTVNGSTDRYTMKTEVYPPVKYRMDGKLAEYATAEEHEAVQTTLLIANMRRKFKSGIKHKYEIDLDIIKKMNYGTDLSHLKVTEIKRMSDKEKEYIVRELEELEAIRRGDIVPGQLKLFYRQEQTKNLPEEVEKPVLKDDTKEDVKPEKDIKEELSLTLIESDEEIEVPKEVKNKKQKRTVKVNESGFYSLTDFADNIPLSSNEGVKQKIELEEEVKEETEAEEVEESTTEDLKQHERSPNKTTRRRKLSDMQ